VARHHAIGVLVSSPCSTQRITIGSPNGDRPDSGATWLLRG
jgi:hypothetical protein